MLLLGRVLVLTTFQMGGSPTSHIPAHTSPAAVAPFRAWPSSQVSVAGGPMGPP